MLTGKVALVTGGGTGIGRAIALALAKEGCRVVVTGRRLEPLQQTCAVASDSGYPGAISAVQGDITDKDQTPLIETVLAGGPEGRLDILANSAGMNIPERSLEAMTVEGWTHTIDVNLHGTFHLVHAVLPLMRKQGKASEGQLKDGGLIVNITSIAGKNTISTLAGSAYCASKFAMNSLGDAINLEEHEHGIRCTNIMPGEVVTEILDKRANPPTQARRALMLQPEDIAAAVLMVATLPPRAHVTQLVMTGKTTLPSAL